MKHFLLCYDIANPRRLQKVHRTVVACALPVQFSVYYFRGTTNDAEALLQQLEPLIKNSEDDIRIYTIEPLTNAYQQGRLWYPEGVYLEGVSH